MIDGLWRCMRSPRCFGATSDREAADPRRRASDLEACGSGGRLQRFSKTERGWKIRKLKNSEHIDACVAAVLAVARARRHSNTPRGAQIFWLESGQ